MRWLALVVPLLLAGCSLVEGVTGVSALPYELRCNDDIDADTCRARAADLVDMMGGPDTVIESVDIGREGYGICWSQPAPGSDRREGGCADGVYPGPG